MCSHKKNSGLAGTRIVAHPCRLMDRSCYDQRRCHRRHCTTKSSVHYESSTRMAQVRAAGAALNIAHNALLYSTEIRNAAQFCSQDTNILNKAQKTSKLRMHIATCIYALVHRCSGILVVSGSASASVNRASQKYANTDIHASVAITTSREAKSRVGTSTAARKKRMSN